MQRDDPERPPMKKRDLRWQRRSQVERIVADGELFIRFDKLIFAFLPGVCVQRRRQRRPQI